MRRTHWYNEWIFLSRLSRFLLCLKGLFIHRSDDETTSVNIVNHASAKTVSIIKLCHGSLCQGQIWQRRFQVLSPLLFIRKGFTGFLSSYNFFFNLLIIFIIWDSNFRSEEKTILLDLSPGQRVRLSSTHNCQNSGQKRLRHILRKQPELESRGRVLSAVQRQRRPIGEGRVMRFSSVQSAWEMEIEGAELVTGLFVDIQNIFTDFFRIILDNCVHINSNVTMRLECLI